MPVLHVVLLMVAVGCSSPGDTDAASPGFDAEVGARLDAALDDLLVELGLPGLSASVTLPDGARWEGATGVEDLAEAAPMTPDTRFKIGSVSKTVTAGLILKRVESGGLDLDDALSRFRADLERADEITVRQLLGHTSGIPTYNDDLEAAGAWDQVFALDDLVDLAADEALLFAPGEGWSYSNTNYVLLGLILEEVDGASWSSITNRELADLGVGLDARAPDEDWGEVCQGYLVAPPGELTSYDGYTEMRDAIHHTTLDPAGGMVGTPTEMAAWGRALWGGDAVVGAALSDAMVQDAYVLSDTLAYGLGAALRDDAYGTQIFHNGEVAGYAAWLGFRPDEGVALAVAGNAWVDDDGPDGSTYSPTSHWTTVASDRLWAAFKGD